MLVIKLKRIGKKHQAAFRLVVDEKRHKLFGKHVEDLGWYNPRQDKFNFQKERILYWLKIGAKPTDTVHNLLISSGVIEGKKIAVHKKAKTKKEVESAKPAGGGAPVVAAVEKPAETTPAV